MKSRLLQTLTPRPLSQPIHIVEPTLEDHRGHPRALVTRFCGAAPELRFRVWAGRKAGADLIPGRNVTLTPWFRRRIRVPQAFFLVRELLREGRTVFIPTAGRTDIVLTDRALGRRSRGKAVLYVHWLRPTSRRLKSLAAVASRRPEMELLTTTATVRDVLLSCGFRSVRHVPYPTPMRAETGVGPTPFRHLLFAGAARRDKGFHRVVELVARLAEADEQIPVLVQTVGDVYGQLSPDVSRDIRRLEALGYPALRIEPGSLDEQRYLRSFQGAVCIQLYDPVDFADRVSGVTLDALCAGAPILVHEGTWMARPVLRFGAGAVVQLGDIAAAAEAAKDIAARYEHFSEAARKAGATLRAERDPRRLVEAVLA